MKWCGKSAPAFPETGRPGKPHPEQGQIGERSGRPAPLPGRPLEAAGNRRPRWMAVAASSRRYRIRLTGPLTRQRMGPIYHVTHVGLGFGGAAWGIRTPKLHRSADIQSRCGYQFHQRRASHEYMRWQALLPRIHRSKLEGAGCRAAGAFGGRAGVRRAVPERGAVAQRRSARLGGAEGAGARVREACAGMLARASDPCWRCERASGRER